MQSVTSEIVVNTAVNESVSSCGEYLSVLSIQCDWMYVHDLMFVL